MTLFADTKAPPFHIRAKKHGYRFGTRATQYTDTFTKSVCETGLTSLPAAGGEDGGTDPALFCSDSISNLSPIVKRKIFSAFLLPFCAEMWQTNGEEGKKCGTLF